MHMRTTIALDDELVKQAEYYTGITEKAALVREALTRLVRNEAARRLAALGGSDPAAEAAPRRQAGRVILVDTSVWIDHLRSADAKLQALLQNDQVMTHPYIRLELALGSMASRQKVLADLALLPQAPVVATEELFSLIDFRKLYEEVSALRIFT